MKNIEEAVKQIQEERGLSEELVLKSVKELMLSAYKKKFGRDENAEVIFNDDNTEVGIYARKTIVDPDDFYDPVSEIVLEEAKGYNEESEIGDELLIELDPLNFDRIAVHSARQKTRQSLGEIQKDTLFSEYNEKLGEIIIGYYQVERRGSIYVDLGNTEGRIPERYQSPRESYQRGDRIRAYVADVRNNKNLDIVLSRTHPEFVKKIFELEVPEVANGTVEIKNIVREPGYRTKIAVYTGFEEVDPVGACVGMKGMRIQNIVRELEGEKIDILRYDPDPKQFIRNALTPASILDVIVLDAAKRKTIAIVDSTQLSLAIGKQGMNVKLANRIVDWNIDVKTVEQYQEMDIVDDKERTAQTIFTDSPSESEEISAIAELPGISERLVILLKENGVELIESLVALSDEELSALNGVTEEDIKHIHAILTENIQILEDDTEQEEETASEEETTDEEEYQCPECNGGIDSTMTACPHCGIGLSFEEEEEENEEDTT